MTGMGTDDGLRDDNEEEAEDDDKLDTLIFICFFSLGRLGLVAYAHPIISLCSTGRIKTKLFTVMMHFGCIAYS